jgi:hypothetical protein
MPPRKEGQQRSNTAERGFDFGCPLHAILPDLAVWTKHLHDAGINGCAYATARAPSLQADVPCITLLGNHPDPLCQAFLEFHRWAKGSDDDAIELTIVFLNNGGYLLGLSPEPERWQARATAGEILLEPLLMMPVWVKPIDTTHPMLRSLVDYQKGLIAPFMLDAALMRGVLRQTTFFPRLGSPFRAIPGLQPLIKFECTFVNESDTTLPPTAQIVLRTHRLSKARKRSGRKSLAPPPPVSPAHQSAKRRRVLDTLFPVTLFRARKSGLLAQARNQTSVPNLQNWQLEQAVANLVLSREFCAGRFHYVSLSKSDLSHQIIRAAREHIELADNRDSLTGIGPTEINRQIGLDAQYLLMNNGQNVTKLNLPDLQEALRRKGFFIDA